MKAAFIFLAILVSVGTFFFLGPGFTLGAAPDFTLSTRRGPGGTTVSLAQLKGRVVVLDFWASWCPPCRAAIPALERIHKDYESRGVAVIGINVNDTVDPHDFMRSMSATYTILIDDGRASREYRVKGIPTLVVIDKTGTIRFRESGFGGASEAKMRHAIEEALAQ